MKITPILVIKSVEICWGTINYFKKMSKMSIFWHFFGVRSNSVWKMSKMSSFSPPPYTISLHNQWWCVFFCAIISFLAWLSLCGNFLCLKISYLWNFFGQNRVWNFHCFQEVLQKFHIGMPPILVFLSIIITIIVLAISLTEWRNRADLFTQIGNILPYLRYLFLDFFLHQFLRFEKLFSFSEVYDRGFSWSVSYLSCRQRRESTGKRVCKIMRGLFSL